MKCTPNLWRIVLALVLIVTSTQWTGGDVRGWPGQCRDRR